MKTIATLGIATALAMFAAAPAEAREGCGPNMHRAPNGMCRPDRHQQQVWVAGRYYAGHGYWYNNRWWHRRYRYGDAWRYR